MQNYSELAIRITLYCVLLSSTNSLASTVAVSQVARMHSSFSSELLAASPNLLQQAAPSKMEFKAENKANDIWPYLTTKPIMDVKRLRWF